MTAFAGTAGLIRLILRRDRFALPGWILLSALLAVSVASSFIGGYPTDAARAEYARASSSSPGVVAMLGPVLNSSAGGLTAWRWTIQGAFVVGLASLLTVVRHTRTEEEAGRRELLGATVVGRLAPLAAALAVTFAADLLIALLVTGGLSTLGLPAAGSLALGLAVAGFGWTCAAVAGIAAQLAGHAGPARGIAGIYIAVAFFVRAIGDAGGSGLSWLSWLSPIGWARLTRPFAGEQWAVLALFAAFAALLTGAAMLLAARRDLGASLIGVRSGPAMAARWLRGPLGLAWRLQRGALLGWAAGYLVIGLALGNVARTVSDLLLQNPGARAFFAGQGGAGPADAVFTLFLLAIAEVSAIFALQGTLRMRTEEVELRAEEVLAGPVARVRWAGSFVLIAALGQAAVLAALGAGAGLTYGLAGGVVVQALPRVVVAALAYAPAIWVLVGIAMLLYGLAPRLAGLAWGALGLCLLIELGGELGLISRPVLDASPFTHVPRVLLGGPSLWPLAGLAVLALVLTVLGLLGFRRRSLE